MQPDSTKELISEIMKLRFQLGLVSKTINSKKQAIVPLIIELDWSENNFNDVCNIFESYADKIKNNEKINWLEFESFLKSKLSVDFQTLKKIIKAFYESNLWRNVCKAYASVLDIDEFHEINHPKNQF